MKSITVNSHLYVTVYVNTYKDLQFSVAFIIVIQKDDTETHIPLNKDTKLNKYSISKLHVVRECMAVQRMLDNNTNNSFPSFFSLLKLVHGKKNIMYNIYITLHYKNCFKTCLQTYAAIEDRLRVDIA